MNEIQVISQKMFDRGDRLDPAFVRPLADSASETESTSLRSAHRKLRSLSAVSVQESYHEKATGAGHVGVLGKKWFLPIKCLPIGVEVDGLKIVSWEFGGEIGNYDTWKDFDGLFDSAAGPFNYSREAVAKKIREMADNGNNVITLENFPEDLIKSVPLPEGFKVMPDLGVIWDSRVLEARREISKKIRPIPTQANEVDSIYFERLDGKGPIRIIHGGNIQAPTIGDYYLKKLDVPYVLIGGYYNVEQEEVRERFNHQGLKEDKLISPWPTSVTRISRNSVARHHALVSKGLNAHALPPNQILKGLSELVRLMRPNAPTS